MKYFNFLQLSTDQLLRRTILNHTILKAFSWKLLNFKHILKLKRKKRKREDMTKSKSSWLKFKEMMSQFLFVEKRENKIKRSFGKFIQCRKEIFQINYNVQREVEFWDLVSKLKKFEFETILLCHNIILVGCSRFQGSDGLENFKKSH